MHGDMTMAFQPLGKRMTIFRSALVLRPPFQVKGIGDFPFAEIGDIQLFGAVHQIGNRRCDQNPVQDLSGGLPCDAIAIPLDIAIGTKQFALFFKCHHSFALDYVWNPASSEQTASYACLSLCEKQQKIISMFGRTGPPVPHSANSADSA